VRGRLRRVEERTIQNSAVTSKANGDVTKISAKGFEVRWKGVNFRKENLKPKARNHKRQVDEHGEGETATKSDKRRDGKPATDVGNSDKLGNQAGE